MKYSDSNSKMFSEQEKVLIEIQDQCSQYAEELLTLVVKRAIRIINNLSICVIDGADDYPANFTTIDILCCEYQSKTLDEIRPLLEDTIDGALYKAYSSLSPKERFFIEYSECFYNLRTLYNHEIDNLIYNHFVEYLNLHWSESKKIQQFQNKRTW